MDPRSTWTLPQWRPVRIVVTFTRGSTISSVRCVWYVKIRQGLQNKTVYQESINHILFSATIRYSILTQVDGMTLLGGPAVKTVAG